MVALLKGFIVPAIVGLITMFQQMASFFSFCSSCRIDYRFCISHVSYQRRKCLGEDHIEVLISINPRSYRLRLTIFRSGDRK